MLDGIKIVIKDTDQIYKVWSHSDLIYHSEHSYLNKSDGSLKLVVKKTFFNLEFIQYEERLEIKGSLHKLFNSGLHNANDFTVSDCIKTIDKLCSQFGIDPVLCNVINLEFGVNITAPVNVSDLVKWLRFHGKNKFEPYEKLDQCFSAGTDYFKVKAYNKTLQFPEYAQPNTFRFEGKTRQSKYLRTKGIKTLRDLTAPAIYGQLSDIILSEWVNVLIFDKRTKKGVKFCNTDFWEEIINYNHRNTFTNTKKKYYKLLGGNGLQNLIYTAISEKLTFLITCANSTSLDQCNHGKPQDGTGVKPGNSIVHIPTIVKVETNKIKHIDQNAPVKTTIPVFTELYPKQINGQHASPQQLKRLCLVTGLDISMQKKRSIFLREKTLKMIKETDPKTFLELEKKYLTEKAKHFPEERQLYLICKKIRNKDSNPRNNRKRFEDRNYPPDQLQFDL